jgi:hypothetical protein
MVDLVPWFLTHQDLSNMNILVDAVGASPNQTLYSQPALHVQVQWLLTLATET